MAEYRYDSSVGEVPPTIINGPAPVDQTVLVAQLQGEVASLQTQVTTLTTQVAAMQRAIDSAQSALAPF